MSSRKIQSLCIKFVLQVCALMTGILGGIAVIVNGYGLQVVSWWWLVGGTVIVSMAVSAMLDFAEQV